VGVRGFPASREMQSGCNKC